MNAWVYILRCADSSYYVGSARGSLERRIGQHRSGEFGGYTSKRRPVELVWSADFQSIEQAILFERQIKGWSHPKKEALIKGDYLLLPLLASRGKAALEYKGVSFSTPQPATFHPSRRRFAAPQDEEASNQ